MWFREKWEDARTKSTSAPKVSIISDPQDYIDMDKNEVKAEAMDICCRAISVGSLHKAYPMTVAVGTGAAARIPGTIVNDIAKPAPDQDIIKIGHSSGVTEVDVKMDGERVIKGRRDPYRKKNHGRLGLRQRLIEIMGLPGLRASGNPGTESSSLRK